MDIKVSLPKPNDTSGVHIKRFLRQLELSVHHLQKSVEEMEKEGELTENTYIIYRFPKMNLYDRLEKETLDGAEGFAKVHVDEENDQMQEIEIEISNV